jgi:hypothetical protein
MLVTKMRVTKLRVMKVMLGDIRTYDVNEKDSQGNSPLMLTCRSGKLGDG